MVVRGASGASSCRGGLVISMTQMVDLQLSTKAGDYEMGKSDGNDDSVETHHTRKHRCVCWRVSGERGEEI